MTVFYRKITPPKPFLVNYLANIGKIVYISVKLSPKFGDTPAKDLL